VTLSPGGGEYVLALADDEHMIGARHTSWIGLGPFLEEDLAFCSIAQDELGHAISLYELVLSDKVGIGIRDDFEARDVHLDRFALQRSPGEYRSCHLAERGCTDWNDSLVRHWLYDRAETIRWTALLDSSNEHLAAIATRALSEESFHLEHAQQFMSRIAPARPDPIIGSITKLLPIALGIWDPVDGEPEAVADGVTSATSAELAEYWELAVRAELSDWGLDIDWPTGTSTRDVQNHRRNRTAGFDGFQADLCKVIDVDPAARW